jgi:hypothetical protein
MSAALERTYAAEFRSGVRAELTLSPRDVRIEWSPGFPRHLRGQRRRRFLQSYRTWRNECVADFARRIGLRVLVVDL